LASVIGALGCPAWAAAPTTSPQWIDITAAPYSADPTDTVDATAAIRGAIAAAVTGGQPLYLPFGTYKVTRAIVLDYAGASLGFRVISDGATLDGRSVALAPVLQVECGGGTPASPTGCFYFKEQGTLQIKAASPTYGFVLGKTDFSDAHNSAK